MIFDFLDAAAKKVLAGSQCGDFTVLRRRIESDK